MQDFQTPLFRGGIELQPSESVISRHVGPGVRLDILENFHAKAWAVGHKHASQRR